MPHTEGNENPAPDLGLRGLALLDKIIEIIESKPGNWIQSWWAVAKPTDQVDDENNYVPESCGTALCVAGWAAHLTGHKLRWYLNEVDELEAESCSKDGIVQPIPDVARDLLGVSVSNGDWLFNGYNTLDDIKEIRNALVEGQYIATH